jgi:hypothetical protein
MRATAAAAATGCSGAAVTCSESYRMRHINDAPVSGLPLTFKTSLARCLILLAIGAVVMGGAELAARHAGFGEPPIGLLDDKIGYYIAPDRSYTRFGHDIRINRYGMRSDDVDIASVDRWSVFSLLGDSVVYGNLLDQADTPPAQLQRLLNAGKPDQKKPDQNGSDQKALVNSIAASGWGSENLLEFYKRFGPFPGNTAWIVENTGDMEDVVDPAGDVPYRTSSPRGALHDLMLSALRGAAIHGLPREARPGTYEDRRRRADAALRALIAALKTDYARVILVFHASRDEAVSGKADGLGHFQKIAREQAIDFVSTMESYARAYQSGLQPHYDDVHLTKDGARILAERLAPGTAPP